MTNLERRLRKIETCLTDSSGLVPHSRKWLLYWDRKLYDFMTQDEPTERVLFTIEAYRAVTKFASDPASLVGSIPETDD